MCLGTQLTVLNTLYLKASVEADRGDSTIQLMKYLKLLHQLEPVLWPPRLTSNMRKIYLVFELKVKEAFEGNMSELQFINRDKLRKAIYLLFPLCVPESVRRDDPARWSFKPLDIKRSDSGESQGHAVPTLPRGAFMFWTSLYSGADEEDEIEYFVEKNLENGTIHKANLWSFKDKIVEAEDILDAEECDDLEAQDEEINLVTLDLSRLCKLPNMHDAAKEACALEVSEDSSNHSCIILTFE